MFRLLKKTHHVKLSLENIQEAVTDLWLGREERLDVDGAGLWLCPEVVVPETPGDPNGGEQAGPLPLTVHHREL